MSLEVYPQSGPPGPIGPTASVLFSAGTLSAVRSDITFNNGSGVTFGLDAGGVITATVQTNYQSAGAYLTTAALSQDSSKYAGTTAGMTGGSLTVDTAGVAISLPAYLTTAQPPGAYLTTAMESNRGSDFVQATAGFFGTNASGTIASDGISVSVNAGGGSLNISAGSTSSNVSAVTFSNGSGVTFGFDGSNVTASVQTNYQTPGAYLTTAALSQDSSKYAGTNGLVQTTAGTDIALTLNTSGATIAYPKWLTTAALSQDSSKYAGTGFTTATTAGTNIVGTLNTSGLSMGIPAYLTTTPTGGAGTGFTSTSTAGSNVVGTLDSNGLSVGVPNYLTTAMASNAVTLSNINISAGTTSNNLSAVTLLNSNQVRFDFNTAPGTNEIAGSFWMKVVDSGAGGNFNAQNLEFDDSNGVSWGIGGYTSDPTIAIITASVRTNYAGTATSVATTTGTDLSFAANTSGITIAYPKWITAATAGGAGTGFTTATTAGTNVVGTLDSNGLSMGVPAYLTTAMASNAATVSNIKVSAGTLSNNLSALTFSDSNGVSWGLNTNSVITATVKTDYQTSGAYLTTAALSQDSSKYAGTATSVVTTTGTDLSMALNTNGLTVAYPKWITTAAAGGGVAVSNSQTLFSTGTVALSEGGGAITIASSAGGQSFMFSVPQTSSLVGVAPIVISTSGSTISVSGNVAGTNTSVATTSGTDLSFAVNTSGVTIAYPKWITTYVNDLTSGRAGVNGSVATTAGTDLALTLNTSGATIGYPKWITTAAQSSAMMSWFQNLDMLDPGSSTMSYGGSVLNVCPFVLPAAMSVGFVRMAGSMSYVSTEASGTTANTTYTVNRSYTHAVMLFTQNTGASSLSLNMLTSSSASWLFQNQIQAGAQGSRYTVTQNVTYPISGTTSNYTTSYPQSSANVQISSASLTLFTGPRFIDIPFGVSLPANNYWIAFGMSTNSATQAGNAALGGASAGFSMIAVTQNNLSFGLMGQVTNSSNPIQPGCGSWSTNAAVMTTASMGLASISAMSSSPKGYFQFIRYA